MEYELKQNLNAVQAIQHKTIQRTTSNVLEDTTCLTLDALSSLCPTLNCVFLIRTYTMEPRTKRFT